MPVLAGGVGQLGFAASRTSPAVSMAMSKPLAGPGNEAVAPVPRSISNTVPECSAVNRSRRDGGEKRTAPTSSPGENVCSGWLWFEVRAYRVPATASNHTSPCGS
jgi:hypothetical protein